MGPLDGALTRTALSHWPPAANHGKTPEIQHEYPIVTPEEFVTVAKPILLPAQFGATVDQYVDPVVGGRLCPSERGTLITMKSVRSKNTRIEVFMIAISPSRALKARVEIQENTY
jgi:hypothetical protein